MKKCHVSCLSRGRRTGDGEIFIGMNSFAVGTEEQPVTLRIYTDRAADQFDEFALGPYATAEIEPYAGIGSESSGDAVVWAVAAVILAAVVAGLVLGRQD